MGKFQELSSYYADLKLKNAHLSENACIYLYASILNKLGIFQVGQESFINIFTWLGIFQKMPNQQLVLPEIWNILEIQKMKICSEVSNFMGEMNFRRNVHKSADY